MSPTSTHDHDAPRRLCRLPQRRSGINPVYERLTNHIMNDSIGLYLNDIGKVAAAHRRGRARALASHRGRPRGRREARQRQPRRRPQGPGGRRGRRQGPVHPVQPAPRREHRPPLPAPPGHGPARPHPGGQPRPRARRRQVRLAPWLQVLHLRHVLDPSGHRPGPRPEGQPHPHPRRPLGQPARRAASGVGRRRDPRPGQRRAAPAHHAGVARQDRRRRRRRHAR